MYSINEKFIGTFESSQGIQHILSTQLVYTAMLETNEEIKKIHDMTQVDIFRTLGMRNLSAFVGETFVLMFEKNSNNLFLKNPHQDGYPDLLLMDVLGQQAYSMLEQKLLIRHKEPFSPFINGGLEVKATCGTVPSANTLAKKGILKPDIGDTRLPLLTSYDWKSHHRETNNLIGIMWDFIQGIPTIVAIFFSSELTKNHWGNIVQPKEGGGRTTSVSIMNKIGTKQMYDNWCVMHQDYAGFFELKNKR